MSHVSEVACRGVIRAVGGLGETVPRVLQLEELTDHHGLGEAGGSVWFRCGRLFWCGLSSSASFFRRAKQEPVVLIMMDPAPRVLQLEELNGPRTCLCLRMARGPGLSRGGAEAANVIRMIRRLRCFS